MFTVPGNEVPAKPGALYAGVIAAVFALVASGAEGYFWLRIYSTLTGMLPPEAAADSEAQRSLAVWNGFLIAIVVVSMLLSLIAAGGVAFALRGANGGRIAVWIAGGFAIAWHLCCSGYVLLFRALFAQAASQSQTDGYSGNDMDLNKYFPMWLVDSAIGSGFTVGIASIVAVTLIALPPVNRYFRALRARPVPYVPPTTPGQW